MITFEMKGLTDILDDLENIEDNLESPFNNVENEIGNLAVDNIKSRTPVISGHLRNGNKSRKTSDNNIEIFNDVEYSIYVDGRKPFFYLDDNTQEKIMEIMSDNIVED